MCTNYNLTVQKEMIQWPYWCLVYVKAYMCSYKAALWSLYQMLQPSRASVYYTTVVIHNTARQTQATESLTVLTFLTEITNILS